jgi:hypothetical protein
MFHVERFVHEGFFWREKGQGTRDEGQGRRKKGIQLTVDC